MTLQELEKRDDELYSQISVKLTYLHQACNGILNLQAQVKDIFLVFTEKHQNDVELNQKLKELIHLNERANAV